MLGERYGRSNRRTDAGKEQRKFKYEMTEILFELKGQFAKYQGEKIDYTESKVFAEELQTKVMKLSAEPVPEISCQSFADDQKWDKPVEKARVPKLDFPSISLKRMGKGSRRS